MSSPCEQNSFVNRPLCCILTPTEVSTPIPRLPILAIVPFLYVTSIYCFLLHAQSATQTAQVQLRHRRHHRNLSRNLCPNAGGVCILYVCVRHKCVELVHLPHLCGCPPPTHPPTSSAPPPRKCVKFRWSILLLLFSVMTGKTIIRWISTTFCTFTFCI